MSIYWKIEVDYRARLGEAEELWLDLFNSKWINLAPPKKAVDADIVCEYHAVYAAKNDIMNVSPKTVALSAMTSKSKSNYHLMDYIDATYSIDPICFLDFLDWMEEQDRRVRRRLTRRLRDLNTLLWRTHKLRIIGNEKIEKK